MTTQLENIDEILSSIQISLKVPKDKENKFGNYAYRNAEGILQAFKEELSKEIYPKNIRIITDFDIMLIGSRTFIQCTAILKVGGEKESAKAFAELDLTKKGMDQAQLTGAATSYAKKYALCNLLSIDDSKDDPDSDEAPKEKPKKNAFGFSPDGELARGDDMKETLQKKNEESAKKIKDELKECETVAEIAHIKKTYLKELNQLNKYAKDLFEEICEIANDVKKEIEESNGNFDDSNELLKI